MAKGVLEGKRILAVDDEPDILEVLADELDKYAVKLDRALSFEAASQMLASFTYDLVILDIMGVRGFDLLSYARSRKFPVVILTAHALNPDTLKRSIEEGARAYVPKDEIDNIVPFLEDVLSLSYESAWKKLFTRLGGVFGRQFGPDWRKSEKDFWDEFDKRLQIDRSTIIES
jgi:CheY-like chemotaxis protein